MPVRLTEIIAAGSSNLNADLLLFFIPTIDDDVDALIAEENRARFTQPDGCLTYPPPDDGIDRCSDDRELLPLFGRGLARDKAMRIVLRDEIRR